MAAQNPIHMGTPESDGNILILQNLDSGYGSQQVLRGINLYLQEGEWLALLGPNGAGKSTLLKTIAGLLKPMGGAIRYQGKEIEHLPAHRRLREGIALVPEGRRLFAGMTIRENLFMGAFIEKERKIITRELERIYNLFPVLKEREKQIVGTLSGGEQQMCAIGRALMSRPQLLLVDELSLGLAPVVVDELLETMAAINREGMTLLVVEQDVHMALVYADRGYVLREGHIAKSGKAELLLKDPSIQKEYLAYWEGDHEDRQ